MKKKYICLIFILIMFCGLFSGCAADTPDTLGKISKPEDIANMTIGVVTGTRSVDYATETYPSATLVHYNNVVDMLSAINSKKIDCLLFDHITLSLLAAENPNLAIFPNMLTQEDYAVAFSKENQKLETEFNRFIDEIKSNGVFDELYKRWVYDHNFKMPEFSLSGENGKLTVGVSSASLLPTTGVVDGKLVGSNVEMAYRFAQRYGYSVEFLDVNFEALIPALIGGKVDFIASDISVTEERKQQVDFSHPYDGGGIVIMALKDMLVVDDGAEIITSYKQLEGKKIGTTSDTTKKFILEKNAKIKVVPEIFNSQTDIIHALATNKIDAALTDDFAAKIYLAENPVLRALPSYGKIDWTFVTSKKNTELIEKANVIIKQLRDDGTIDKIKEKWSQRDLDGVKLEPVTFTGENGALNISYGGEYPGYSFYYNNELVGADIDVANLVFSKLGYTLNPLVINDDAAIEAIVSGKINVATLDVDSTSERSDQVAFFDTIYENNLVALVYNPQTKGAFITGILNFFSGIAESFNRTFILENRWQLVLSGLWITIIISLFSMIFGTLLGAGICAMRRSKIPFFSGLASFYVRIFQGTPIIVILMILYYVIFGQVNINSIFVAILGFCLNFSAYTSEMFRTGIDAVDKGQLEAAAASGFSKSQVFFLITLPQAAKLILPVYKGEFISMVKMTSVVGYIAIQDLTKVSDIIRSRTFEAFFPLIATAIIYFLITYVFIILLNLIEIKIDPKRRKRIVKGIAPKESN